MTQITTMKTPNLNGWATSIVALLLTATQLVRANDIHVPADHATIQAAVNAALDGDTIHIAPGVYVEQVFVNRKSVNLIGQPGAIMRAFHNMALGGGDNRWRPILYINHSPNSTVRGLTFEGDQLANRQAPGGFGFSGVYFLEAGGAVENCRFTGFRESVPGTNRAFALRMWNDLAGVPVLSARITDNVIEDSYSGISVVGSPTLGYTNFVVSNNTVRGVGTTTTSAALRGIDLGRGMSGSVVNNTVSDFSYIRDTNLPPVYPSGYGIVAASGGIGFLAKLEPIRFENNTLRDNGLPLIILRADEHEVIRNRIIGNGPSERRAGIWITGTNIVVRENVLEGMDTGIRLGGNDWQFGTGLGVALNALLANNRFCNVVTNIDQQPLATATITNNLTCPIPEPELTKERGVLLSWPEIEEGYEVETGPTSSGPWAPFEGTYFIQDGTHRAAAASSATQSFFRLIKP